MKGVILGFVVGAVGLLTWFLVSASNDFPESGSAAPPNLNVSVYPLYGTSYVPHLSAACAPVAPLGASAVTAGSARVVLRIGTGQIGETTIVKRVVITVLGEQGISAASYRKCAKALPVSHSNPSAELDVRLPRHGSMLLPSDLARTGTFSLDVLPPAGHQSVPHTCIWYVSVTGSIAGEAVEGQSKPLVMLVGGDHHSRV